MRSSRIWDRFWSKFLNNLKQMFKEQIKENSFSSKRQHDMFTTRWVSARTMKSTLRNAKHCVLFLWRCPKLNIEIPSTWMSRQLVLTHAWIIKNWNGIISKTRDKGLLLDYCTSGAGLPFYAIASSDSSRFNRGLPHYASFTAYNIDHRTIALERVWWF